MEKMLNSHEVEMIAGSKVGILPYSKLSSDVLDLYTSIYDKILILYQTSHGPRSITGHWTALKVLPNNEIAFYDSYGEQIDNQLDHIKQSYRAKSNQVKSILANWLGNSDYRIVHYNPHQHQFSSNICGRLAGLFLKSPDEPEAFNKKLKDLSKLTGIKIPELSVDLTEPLLKIPSEF